MQWNSELSKKESEIHKKNPEITVALGYFVSGQLFCTTAGYRSSLILNQYYELLTNKKILKPFKLTIKFKYKYITIINEWINFKKHFSGSA